MTYDRAWKEMGHFAKVVTVVGSTTVSTIQNGGYSFEVSIKVPMPSRNKWVQDLIRHAFRDLAPSILLNIDSFLFSLTCLARCRKLFKMAGYIHTYHFWFAFLSLPFPSIRKKVVYTELGGEWIEIAERRAPLLVELRYHYLGRWVLNHITVIAQSVLNKRCMVLSGVKDSNVRVVRHARSDPALFCPSIKKSGPKFRVLYVGRIVPWKGLHVLVDAADILLKKREHCDIVFTIVGPVGGFGYEGSSTYFEEIRRLIEDKGLERYFEFKSFVELHTLIDLYSEASVYVLPSIQDALPFSVIEAMMCGTAVIGTRSGGMVEMIEDGRTGFLVSPGDAESLAERMESLIIDPRKALLMGVEGRKRAVTLYSDRDFPVDLFKAITANYKPTSKIT